MANTQGPQSTSKCESHLCSKVDKEERKPILERTDQEIKLTKLAQYLHSTVTLMKQETVKWCDVIGEREITRSVQLEFGGWKKWQYDGHSTQNYAPYLGIVWTPPHYKDVLKGPFAIEWAIHSMFTWPHVLHWNEFSWSNYFPGLKHLGVALFGSVGPLHPLVLLLHLLHLAHNPTPQGRH